MLYDLDCTKGTIYTLFQVPKDEKTREQWTKADSDTYSNMVLNKTLITFVKCVEQLDIVAFYDVKDATCKIFQRVSVIGFLNLNSSYVSLQCIRCFHVKIR